MHRTQTVDYCLILDGEIFLFLDHSECLMRRGDVVVQRGTNHAWSNRTGETTYVAFILIDAEPA
mgnify:CR=1 FL=1